MLLAKLILWVMNVHFKYDKIRDNIMKRKLTRNQKRTIITSMIGKYTAITPINSAKLKENFKKGNLN